jgi:hypothetical protein
MGCDYNIETSLAQRKTTRQMDVLHGKTVPGVLKEVTVFAIVYKNDDDPGCRDEDWPSQPMAIWRVFGVYNVGRQWYWRCGRGAAARSWD